MTTRPSEKSIEILFNHYLLQMFPAGSISLIAPSSVEEYITGYDTKIIGSSSFQELYLQFKSPSHYSAITNKSTIRTYQGYMQQHHLLQAYPPKTAYYVSHTFHTITEMLDAQRLSKTPEEFLRHYIAIETSQLPVLMTFLHHSRDASNTDILDVGYMRRILPSTSPACIRGDDLVKKFRSAQAGIRVQLTDTPLEDDYLYREDRIWRVSLEHIKEMCSNNIDSEFGVLIRINSQNAGASAG